MKSATLLHEHINQPLRTMTTVMISQPMFLPWAGFFDASRMADIFVHYDDVQMPLGRSFLSRVQIKLNEEIRWLSAPVQRHSGQRIMDVEFDGNSPWKTKHVRTLHHALAERPHTADALDLILPLYSGAETRLCEFNIQFIERALDYLAIKPTILRSSELNIDGHATDRISAICQELGATRYITGHGARGYLDHSHLERGRIQVEYMNYDIRSYEQPGIFTPYVTILDLVASVGSESAAHFGSTTVPWREFLNDGT